MSNNKCIYHMHLGVFSLYCFNYLHDFKGGVKINVSCYILKLTVLTLTPPPLKKWFPSAWD